jgi:hypothetical protein
MSLARTIRLAHLAALAVALAAAPRALAGVVFEMTQTSDETKDVQRMLVDGKKLRMETRGGAQVVIFDGDAQRMLQLDAASRSYTEFTREDLARMKEMMSQARAKAGAAAPKARSVRYEKTGRTDQALGKRCDVYRLVQDDGAGGELCLAPFGTFGVDRGDLGGFRALGELTSEMAGGDVERGWADVPGVPLVGWDVEGGERRETFRTTKVEKRSVAASEFAVPAGWKKNPGFAEQMDAARRGAAGK